MSTTQRRVRVFLSSTFTDFQEERSLLVKQVFPQLRQRARSRGVEVIDVDLRWGITEEQSRQGLTLPICLQEVDRCRPYFVAMLGDRYGTVPDASAYPPELLERQPWLAEHIGGRSVTELEILHGVLNDPAMTGRAFFYLRDPAYSAAQPGPGWRSETADEATRLADLKQRIRDSGMPVVEDLPDPAAIAERIEADLWALIEEQYPEQEPPNARAQEEVRHAGYRADRLSLYLGGEGYIRQLEDWLAAGEQRILIGGESGAGKSALVANWVEAHSQGHPQDRIYCHHLGCSNDANAVEPLVRRMLQTVADFLGQEPPALPEDSFELFLQVPTALANLSTWCERQNSRWIWVLDGLDRLEEQQALPWLPVHLPLGVHVIATALEGEAAGILQSREYRELTIGPLHALEQEVLIHRYLERYTKRLERPFLERILEHPPARSPLYLRVLLEELRQCARFETLPNQLDYYLSADSVEVLYARLLERLEQDGHGEEVRRALTALWASRAGLSEPELLSIAELTPLQWAPIGIALEQALATANNRWVFGHDYLRQAVEARYLPTEEQRRQIHRQLADWFEARGELDARVLQEMPWQWLQADRPEDLRAHILNPYFLASLIQERGPQEVLEFWKSARQNDDLELDELVAPATKRIAINAFMDLQEKTKIIDQIASFLVYCGLCRKHLLDLRKRLVKIKSDNPLFDSREQLEELSSLAEAYRLFGDLQEAERTYKICHQKSQKIYHPDHPLNASIAFDLSVISHDLGRYEEAEKYGKKCLLLSRRVYGEFHPRTFSAIANLAYFLVDNGKYAKAVEIYESCIPLTEAFLGSSSLDFLLLLNNFADLHMRQGNYEEASRLYALVFSAQEKNLGATHPYVLNARSNLATSVYEQGDLDEAEKLLKSSIEVQEYLLGCEHPDTLSSIGNLASVMRDKGDYEQAESLYRRCYESRKKRLGIKHPKTLVSMSNLASMVHAIGDYDESYSLYQECLDYQESLLGLDHDDTLRTVREFAFLIESMGDYKRAELMYRSSLEGLEKTYGANHPEVLDANRSYMLFCMEREDHQQVEKLQRSYLLACEAIYGVSHVKTIQELSRLAHICELQKKLEESVVLFERCYQLQKNVFGQSHSDTLHSLHRLAMQYFKQDLFGKAEALFRLHLEVLDNLSGIDEDDLLLTIECQAACLKSLGRIDEYLSLLQRALVIVRRKKGANHSETQQYMDVVASALGWAGQLEESELLFRELLESRLAVCDPADPDISRAWIDLGHTLRKQRNLQDARQCYEQGLTHRLQHLGSADSLTNAARRHLSELLRDLGDITAARCHLQDLLTAMVGLEDPDEEDQQLIDQARALLQALDEAEL